MRRFTRLVRLFLPLVVVAAALSLVVAPAAGATSSISITSLSSRAGYNSVSLYWQPPADRQAYRGVTIWRQPGNDQNAVPVLVATLDRSRTSYTDAGVVVPSTRVWTYTVYTRDVVEGPVNPQTTSDWMTSAMSGRVTDAQGNGLAGVLVEIGYQAWSSGESTMTAADGTWFVDGVRESTAVACFDPRDAATGGASATGYLSECYDDVLSVPYYDSPNGQPQKMTVGTLTSGIDARLTAGGAVSGVFRDQRGHRLANVVVTAVRDDGRVDRRLATDRDGGYRAVGLAPGRYDVCGFEVRSDGPVSPPSPFGFLETCAGDTAPGASSGVEVSVGASTPLDITLADGGAITGQLLGPGGSPVVGEYPQWDGPYAPESTTTPTDANGRYTIKGLVGGTYTVCFRGSASTGSGDGFDPGRVARCWKAAETGAATPIAVATGRVSSGISVRQEANPSVEGRVVDAEGRPLRLVDVVVDGLDSFTDADGRYRVGVPPGDHRVCFNAQDAVGASLSGYVDRCWGTDSSGAGTPTKVHVARGARVTGVNTTLAVAAGVRVTVVDAHGTPLENALIDLYSSRGRSYSALTNARGIVVFTRVYQATGYVASFDPSLWAASPPAPYGYRQSRVTVRVKTGLSSARLVAVSNGMITGTVFGPAGQPLENALVEVTGSSYAPSNPTAADGTYEVNGLAPGTYTVCFSGYDVDDGGTNRRVTGCYDRTTEATATPVQVPDGTAVTGVDGHLVVS